MSRGFPSMTALLGLLAVAGYQNRDKIAEMLGGGQGGRTPGGAGGGLGGSQGGMGGGLGGMLGGSQGGAGGGLGGLLGGLGGLLGGAGAGAGAGGLVNGGLGELVENFRRNGQGETVDSWVNQGPNCPIESSQLERAIGPDVLDELTQKTGLSREELLSRLSRELPDAVDRYTPEGRLPGESDFGRL